MSNFISPAKGKITSPFGMRYHPIYKENRMHWGIDIGNYPADNSILASSSGTVTLAKFISGYGNTIMIVHSIKGKVYETVYAHLASIGVKVGQTVGQGQKIAVKGTTGSSTGIHLHFELHEGRWSNKFSNARDPLLHISCPEISQLQQLLNKHDYKLFVDGIAGSATTSAIKDFQKNNGLEADGIAGVATLAKLKAVTNPPPNPQPSKETIRMFNPSSNTLKQAIIEEFTQAVKDNIIDNKWLVQLQQGKLSLDDAFALKVIIEQRRKK